MILQKLAQAIRRQDWFQVVIEVLIVIVGIFLGLQVSEWNDQREERLLEQDYLTRLKVDIEADLENYKTLERIFEIKISTAMKIRDFSVQELNDLPPEELLQNIKYSTFVSLPRVQTSTFDELRSTGILSLIQKEELRFSLSEYYTDFEHLFNITKDPIGDYRKLIYENLLGELRYNSRPTDALVDHKLLSSAIKKLKADPAHFSAANAAMNYGDNLLLYIERFENEAEEILQQLDANIE